MHTHQATFTVSTRGKSTTRVDAEVRRLLDASGVHIGLCNVFVKHTSASLIITENADPDVQRDLLTYFDGLVRDGDHRFQHRDEGPDDMSAHVRSVLTQSSISIPVVNGHLDLGTWQGLYLFEHRSAPHTRRITVTILGARR